MAFPIRAIALVAALAPGVVHAQPIVSPRQVADPDTPPSAKPAEPAAAPKGSSKQAAPPSKQAAPPSKQAAPSKTAAPSPNKAAAPSRTRKPASLPSKPTASPTKPAPRASKAATPASNAKSASKTASSTPRRADVSQARLVAPAKRGGRGDNMPVGFAWPPNAAMRAAGAACEDELTALGVHWRHAAPEGHIAAPIELTDPQIAGIQYTSKWRPPPHTLDCQLARALVEVGPALYALGVRQVRWGSIYRWSNVRTQGREFPALSRHALGLAMDIVEFVDDTGRVANVEQHYTAGDPLLLAIEQAVNASGQFRIVLTPKNDPASHYDHFHIEANPRFPAR